jgi:hypothetical protein
VTARKVAVRAAVRGIPPPSQRRTRGRARLFLVLTIGAGAGAGLFAMIASAFLVDLQNLVIDVHSNITVQSIAASSIFPPVPPQHKTIDVYDPPAAGPPANPSPNATPPPDPSPSPDRPRRSPRPTPSGTPSPDD